MICVERRTSVPAVRERERAVRPRLDGDMETTRVPVAVYSAAAYRAAPSDGRDTRSKAVGPSRHGKRYDLQDPLTEERSCPPFAWAPTECCLLRQLPTALKARESHSTQPRESHTVTKPKCSMVWWEQNLSQGVPLPFQMHAVNRASREPPLVHTIIRCQHRATPAPRYTLMA